MHAEDLLNQATRKSVAVLCAQIHRRHRAELPAIVRCAASRAFRIFLVFQADDGVSLMATRMAITLPTTCKEIDREGNISSFGELPQCEEGE